MRSPALLLVLLLLRFLSPSFAGYQLVSEPVPEPMREFRGAWVASVFNINWPSKPGLSAATQKAELIALLEKAQALKLNAILLQVRPGCDALYNSSIEPWSAFLTGTSGKTPGYDPLEFAVPEAHLRGLELHAWINPFRALVDKTPMAATHVSRVHPAWIRPYGSQSLIDPGEPKVREYSQLVCMDIVRRYNIDGLHLDDYFYPYPIKNSDGSVVPFNDDATYLGYGNGQDRAAWRRANIDEFVAGLYTQVKSVKPWVKVGISPFGIWRPGVPEGIVARLDAYQDLAGDSRRWLQEGWCDYFSPQLYWQIDPPDQSFSALLDWWQQQNRQGRHLWPGIATDRIGSKDDPTRTANEMIRQINLTRSGQVHWNIGALVKDKGGIDALLKAGPYAETALVPASPWLGKMAPAAPDAILLEAEKGVKLTLMPQAGVRWWIVQAKAGKDWTVAAVSAGKEGQISIGKPPAVLSIRACSNTGILGPPLVWRK